MFASADNLKLVVIPSFFWTNIDSCIVNWQSNLPSMSVTVMATNLMGSIIIKFVKKQLKLEVTFSNNNNKFDVIKCFKKFVFVTVLTQHKLTSIPKSKNKTNTAQLDHMCTLNQHKRLIQNQIHCITNNNYF